MTGPIGAGKSKVAETWAKKGASIVEGDRMGHLALQSNEGLRLQLADRFGNSILDQNKQVKKTELARIAFSTKVNQQALTEITFPALYSLACEHLNQIESEGNPSVFDAALIYEWGVEGDFDFVVVVTAPEKMLIQRVTQRLGIDSKEAASRLANQMSPRKKARKADFVIVNDKSFAHLRDEALKVWDCMVQSRD